MVSDCGKESCNARVKENSRAVQCEICEARWHQKCTSLDDKAYEALTDANNGIHWYCDLCKGGSKKIYLLVVDLQKELNKVKAEVATLKSEKARDKFSIDRLEQYTRKDNMLISNITDPHLKDEDTNDVAVKLARALGVEIKPEDISTSHRLGKVTANYVRPVIVRFARRDVKRQLMMKRKMLKNNLQYPNVYINDDLTRNRYKITKELRDKEFRVWTQDGKIFYKKEEQDNTSILDTYEDFCKLQWDEGKLSELGILQ